MAARGPSRDNGRLTLLPGGRDTAAAAGGFPGDDDDWRGRESEKQVRSRACNDSLAGERQAPTRPATENAFRCECGDQSCGWAISPTLEEYEAVRAHATRFAVASNHENPESEQVVEENERFAVVEAVTRDAVKLARRTYTPRGPARGRKLSRALETARRGREAAPSRPPSSVTCEPSRRPAGETVHGPIEDGSGRPRLDALSAALVRLARDYGRRPTRAITWWLHPGCVVTALEDYLTPAEQALVQTGHTGLLQELRAAFAHAMAGNFLRTAERTLGLSVSTHRSQLLCQSSVCLEIFMLPHALWGAGESGTGSPLALPRRDRA